MEILGKVAFLDQNCVWGGVKHGTQCANGRVVVVGAALVALFASPISLNLLPFVRSAPMSFLSCGPLHLVTVPLFTVLFVP